MEIPISQFIEMFGDPVENPKDFDKCPLMSLAKKITDGVHKKPVYTKTGKPFISVTNINRGVIDFTDCKFVSEEAYQTMIKTTYPERGDVLYTKVGATYGIPAYVDTDEQFGLYVSVCLIKPKHDLIDARFLTESMRMEYIKKQADDRIKGIGVPDLHLQEIKSFEVLCPPRELQEQFVAFVQQSDKSKFACLKSQFIEVFGDPVENPHGWLTKGLMELGSCKNGMNFGAKDIGVTIKSVGVGDIKDYDNIEDIESLTTISLNEMPSEEYMLKDGDLVFVRSNGNKELVGRCVAVYPHETPVSFSGFCIRFRKESSDVLLEYLLRYLKMPEVRAKMAGRGANIQNLNQKILAALQVPVPPLETQMAYVAFVRQSDKSKLCFHLHTTTLHYAHS